MAIERHVKKCSHLARKPGEPVGVCDLLVGSSRYRDGLQFKVEVCVICAAWLSNRIDEVEKGSFMLPQDEDDVNAPERLAEVTVHVLVTRLVDEIEAALTQKTDPLGAVRAALAALKATP